jgi:hypothetical protein
MSEGSIVGFGVASIVVALAGAALIASGGLLLLPGAFLLGAAAIIGWVLRRPRTLKTTTGAAIGGLTMVAVTGFAIYGTYFAW